MYFLTMYSINMYCTVLASVAFYQEIRAVTEAGEVRGELFVLLEHEVAQHAGEAERVPDRLYHASHTRQ